MRLSFCYYGIQHDCTKADVMQYGNGIKVTGSMSKIRIVRNVIIVALLRAVILHDSSTVSTTENVRMFVKTILTFFYYNCFKSAGFFKCDQWAEACNVGLKL